MSLQLAAQHLASRGRGPDTQLIHMAPQEVAGLHALAKAHGGELTINPDTGLPEAGFLSSLLPMIIGAGLSFIPGVGPLMAAGIVGGGTTLATGSLQKGLMAGLGAYGGAGLAGGLAGAGTGALSSAAGSAAAGSVLPSVATEAVAPALLESAAGTGLAGATPAMGADLYGSTVGEMAAAYGPGVGPAVTPFNAAEMVTRAVPTVTQAPALSQSAADIGNAYAQEQAAQNAVAKQLASATPYETAKAGFGEVMKDPSRFMTKENLKYAGMAAAPGIMEMLTPKQRAEAEKEKLKAYEYNFAYNPTGAASGYRPIGSPTGYDSSEMQHFDPRFTRTAAGGGLMDIAPIEAMSQQNQSQMRPAYAQGGVSDMAVNPYTGAENFAEGGATKAVKPVEQDPYYSMTGMSGDVYKYLMGQGSAPRAPAPAPSTGATGFLKGITGFASPEGIVDITTGQLTPWSASNPKPTGGGFFGGPETAVAPVQQKGFAGLLRRLGAGAQPGQGGEYVDDTSSLLKAYDFDPVSGMMTPKAAPKVFRPYTAAPAATTNLQDVFHGAANGGLMSLAQGGQSHLGDYSDGGRLLRGPGDGVSDSIPASIGDKRPARLADGEFVVPARIVSELGNGSTEAGARKLYAMMDRVQKARAKTTGKDRVATNTKAERLLPV